MQWFDWYDGSGRATSWKEFREDLIHRFGCSLLEKPLAFLSKNSDNMEV